MAGELLIATQFVAAAAMVALAGWLLWLNPRHRANQAFAAFLVARGAVIVCNRLRSFATTDAVEEAWTHAAEVSGIVVATSLALFVVAYVRHGPVSHPWVARGIVTISIISLVMSLAVPCALACQVGNSRWLGPLSLIDYGIPLLMAAGVLVLTEHAWRAGSPARRHATLLIAGALGLNSFLDASVVLAQIITRGTVEFLAPFYPGPWRVASLWIGLFAYVPLGAALAIQQRRHRTRDQLVLIMLAGLALLTAFFVVGRPRLPVWAEGAETGILGLWRLLLPATAGYALLRYGLFDIDLRLKRTIHRGAIAVVFLGVFFVVAQVVQNYLSQTLGYLVGGVAAGLLLFALRPIQMMSERIADSVMPRTKAIEQLGGDARRELYLAQVQLAWADGVLDRSERRLLDDLRVRLGLTHEEAAAIETQGSAEVAPR